MFGSRQGASALARATLERRRGGTIAINGVPCTASVILIDEETILASTCYQAVEEYVTASASRSDLDRTSAGKGKKKTGTDTGAVAVHPLSGEKVCLRRSIRC